NSPSTCPTYTLLLARSVRLGVTSSSAPAVLWRGARNPPTHRVRRKGSCRLCGDPLHEATPPHRYEDSAFHLSTTRGRWDSIDTGAAHPRTRSHHRRHERHRVGRTRPRTPGRAGAGDQPHDGSSGRYGDA